MKSRPIEVFNRHEYKYLISANEAADLLDFLADKMILDEHNQDGRPYQIHNLYVDTDDRQLIRNSLDKPLYKQKIRLRSYFDFDDDDTKVFLEIKKKYDGKVNKRRTKISLGDAKKFIESAVPPKSQNYHNAQVIKELSYALSRHKLSPSVVISYRRIALFNDSRDLRITIDADVIARSATGSAKMTLLPPDRRLLEIKSHRRVPLWLTEYLSRRGIHSSSFSKYGHFHLQALKVNRIKENVLCSTT